MRNLTHTYLTITHLHHLPNLVWSQQLLQQHCRTPAATNPGLEDRNRAPEPLQLVVFVDEKWTQVYSVMGHMEVRILGA